MAWGTSHSQNYKSVIVSTSSSAKTYGWPNFLDTKEASDTNLMISNTKAMFGRERGKKKVWGKSKESENCVS